MNLNNDYTNRHAYFEGKSHGTVPLDKELQAPENAKKGELVSPGLNLPISYPQGVNPENHIYTSNIT